MTLTATGALSRPVQSVEDWLVGSSTWQDSMGGEAREKVHWGANEEALRGNHNMARPFAVLIPVSHRYRQVSVGCTAGMLGSGEISLFFARNATYIGNMRESIKDFMNWAGGIINDMTNGDSPTPPHITAIQLQMLQRVSAEKRDPDGYDFWEVEYRISYGG